MNIIERWTSSSLMLRILAGIVIGSILALVMPGVAGIGMLGDMFVGALKGIAPVLVGVLVAASVAKANAGLGSRFKTVILLYMTTTLIAAVISVFASRIFPISISLGDIAGQKDRHRVP